MNQWNGIGRLTRDAESRNLPDGTFVVSFTLAVDTGTKASPATMFLDCAAFGKTGEVIGQYACSKGTQIAVTTRLKQDNWTEKESGKNRSKICCVVERATLLGSKRDSADQSPSQYAGSDSQQPTAEQAANGFDGSREVDPTGDVPF